MARRDGQLTPPVGADDHAQGPRDAPITLVEYGDYECPHCGQAYPIVKRIQAQLGERLRFVFRNFPLVPAQRWVIANFRETQIRRVARGQPASFRVDALGGARFTGHVEEVSPAAGSEFSVLRPDNATGNFVKVAQRIGVRIAIDPDQPMIERLRPGMSVEARVDARGGP